MNIVPVTFKTERIILYQEYCQRINWYSDAR